MGEYIVVDVTRIRCQHYLGIFSLLWLLMTFCVVQPETLNNFRLVFWELTLLRNTVYS